MLHNYVPSDIYILPPAIFRTFGWKPWTFVDDLADGWFADEVSCASGHVSVRDVGVDDATEIDLRLRAMFAENVQQILPHDVPTTSINPPHSINLINIDRRAHRHLIHLVPNYKKTSYG